MSSNVWSSREFRYGLLASTSPLAVARRDFIITPIIASALVTTFGISQGLANVIAAIVFTAAVTGLQYLLTPKPPKPADGKAPLTQAIPPIFFGVGRRRVAGAYMLWDVGEVGTYRGYLFAVQAMLGHKAHAFNRLFLNDDIVSSRDGDGIVTGIQDATDDRYLFGAVTLQTRNGLATETAYSNAVSAFATSGLWTTNHRGDGTASLMAQLRPGSVKTHQHYFPSGIPRVSAELDMAVMWDFRDNAQDPDDEDTWEFSKNPAVAICWYLCFCKYGPRLDYREVILPVIDRWIEEADICDEAISLAAGGTEPRYETHGFANTQTDPVAILNAMLASCDGHLAQHGDGTWVLTVGKFREELVETVYDWDIAGSERHMEYLEEDRINRLVPKFCYPDTLYSEAITAYFESLDDQLLDGRVLSRDAAFEWVNSWTQARRLGKREWLRRQEKIHGSFVLRLSGVNAVYARWIRLATPNRVPAMNGKLIENKKVILALSQGGYRMEWIQHPDPVAIEAWTPATDEGAKPHVPPRPETVDESVPDIQTITVLEENGSVFARVVIQNVPSANYGISYRYRIKNTGAGIAGPYVDIEAVPTYDAGTQTFTFDTSPLPAGQRLDYSAAYISSSGTVGAYCADEEVLSGADGVAPKALISFAATGGYGQSPWTIVSDVDSHLDRVHVFLVPVGGTLDKNVHTRIVVPNVPDAHTTNYTYGDATIVNQFLNPTLATSSHMSGTNWVWSSTGGGRWTHTPGSASGLNQPFASGSIATPSGAVRRIGGTIGGRTAGTLAGRISGTTGQNGTAISANGAWRDEITAVSSETLAGFGPSSTFDGYLTGPIWTYLKTTDAAPQGIWDLYPFPANRSGVEGPGATPVTNVVIN